VKSPSTRLRANGARRKEEKREEKREEKQEKNPARRSILG
jgi:hypothetical protein